MGTILIAGAETYYHTNLLGFEEATKLFDVLETNMLASGERHRLVRFAKALMLDLAPEVVT